MSKKHLKKGFAISAIAIMVVCLVINASAATQTTTTEYIMGETNVTVTSYISDVGNGEQVTYLAYDFNRSADGKPVGGPNSNIIFIDQKAANASGYCEFEYKADISKIGSTFVKFGAATSTELGNSETATINAYIVTINTNGNGTVTINNNAATASPYILSGGGLFKINPNDGYKVKSIAYGEQFLNLPSQIISDKDGNVFFSTGAVTGNTTLAVQFEEESVSENTVNKGNKFNQLLKNAPTVAERTITAFSRVAVKAECGDNFEYGVIFSYAENPTFATFDAGGDSWSGNVVESTNFKSGEDVTYAGIIKYRALGKGNDGRYAVQLTDGGSNYLNGAPQGKYWMTPYLAIGTDVEGTIVYDYENAEYGPSVLFDADIE